MLNLPSAYVGPAAGLATSFLWTATSLLFTAASRRIGPVAVNTSRIAFAFVLLALTHRLLAGVWIPHVLPRQILFLAISGVIGLSIGDQALFNAFMDIGPRLATLIMTTAPLFAALFGFVALGETLPPIAWVGVILTVGGVAWVVAERAPSDRLRPEKHRLRGLLMALVAAACQAGGLLLSKQGIGHGWLPREEHLPVQTATLVRMVFAGAGMVPILLLHAWRRRIRRGSRTLPNYSGHRLSGYLLAAGGAVAGPFLGVWMSLKAGDLIPLGVAQTLCSLPPIFILPFSATIHKERIGVRAIVGAIIAVGGAALLVVRFG